MNIISSSYTLSPQIDGRDRVVESHVIDDGRILTFDYMADQSIDKGLVMSLRATRLNDELAAQSAAQALASLGKIPLTKLQFRRLFTPTERLNIDAFNIGFESHPMLTTEQKAAIRSSLEDYEVASSIELDDEATIGALYMYESLGLIAVGRASEILNG